MSEVKSSLSVSDNVRMKVREAAAKARISMYEYANQALLHCIENVTVTIRVKGPDNEHSGEMFGSTDD